MSDEEIYIPPLMKKLLMATWVLYLCSFVNKRKEEEDRKAKVKEEARRKRKEEEAASRVNNIEGYCENCRDPEKLK